MTKPLSNNSPKPDVYLAEQTTYTNLTNSQPAASEKEVQALTNQSSAQNDTFKYEGQMRRFQLAQAWANRNTTSVNNASVDGGGGNYVPKTVIFEPHELGAVPRKGKLPPQIKVDESHFEQQLFKSYGLDEFDPRDRAILQNIFQKENPGDGINWTAGGKAINKLTATLNSQGQYEVSFELDKGTDKKLNQALFNKVFFPNQTLDLSLLNLLGTNANSGNFQQTAENPDLTELALDLTQMGLDVVGIFEPTPFADLTNTGISVVRGNWGDAALSVLGVVPYVGDLAKLGKIPKWIKAIDKISSAIDKFKDVARYGGKGAEAVKEFVKKAKSVIDNLPIDKLPDALRDAVKSVKQKIDDFFASMKKADNPADEIKKSEKIGETTKPVDNTKTTTKTETTPKQPDVEPPKKPNDVDKQKKIEELKAKRAEAEAQKKLQEGIKDAEKRPSYKKLPEADRKWLESDPRHKELAFDPDQKKFKIEEAKAALEAERSGVIKGPLKRAIDDTGSSRGDDYIDAGGRGWDVKDGRDFDKILESANKGEDILVDATKLTSEQLLKLQTDLKKLLNSNAGEVRYIK